MDEFAQSGIIEPKELKEIVNDPSVRVIDATFVIPGAPENPRQSWERQRIGSAVFFDIDEIADQNTDLPHMLPAPQEFETAISKLGISNDNLVVVYGQSGMVMGPARVWWTFRAFGHDNICVLNGGLPAWKAAGLDLNTGPPEDPAPGTFKAAFRKDLVKSLDETKEALDDKNCAVLDARPPGRYSGAEPEPRTGLRPGHMNGAANVPAGSLVDETGQIKSESALQEIFTPLCAQKESLLTTCGSGVTAAMIALALFRAGYKNAAVYDGSWAEWGQESLDTEVIT